MAKPGKRLVAKMQAAIDAAHAKASYERHGDCAQDDEIAVACAVVAMQEAKEIVGRSHAK